MLPRRGKNPLKEFARWVLRDELQEILDRANQESKKAGMVTQRLDKVQRMTCCYTYRSAVAVIMGNAGNRR